MRVIFVLICLFNFHRLYAQRTLQLDTGLGYNTFNLVELEEAFYETVRPYREVLPLIPIPGKHNNSMVVETGITYKLQNKISVGLNFMKSASATGSEYIDPNGKITFKSKVDFTALGFKMEKDYAVGNKSAVFLSLLPGWFFVSSKQAETLHFYVQEPEKASLIRKGNAVLFSAFAGYTYKLYPFIHVYAKGGYRHAIVDEVKVSDHLNNTYQQQLTHNLSGTILLVGISLDILTF